MTPDSKAISARFKNLTSFLDRKQVLRIQKLIHAKTLPTQQESYLEKLQHSLVVEDDLKSELMSRGSGTTIDYSAKRLEEFNSAVDLFSEHPELAEPHSPFRNRK